ncbi:putative rho-type gtpase-activating protein 1 protein [Botrytis fragariae]|uniref:Putative rho-type gtpase-activating protein 1 protein n=1 Tax=Botrytis fragariae TaxID=1964551 RepID=A0A8H6ANU7_9HELO|nr:putative rho-type gtpase-activating protein 1 protein [Botrytis fragariae]KAF5870778.1 putative rho-type gtpase-activating protein 1 protein [Botrytis fragariae]
MGPQSEAGPYAEGENYDPSHSDDGGRLTTERDITMQDQHLPRPNGPDRRMNASPANSVSGREGPMREGSRRPSNERTRSRTRTGRTGSGSLRLCKKCGEPLTGQFVRALGGTFHLDCFRCRDCGQIVASKFFPVDEEDGEGQYPLCETDYFRRLDLICHQCNGALRGSYITALERKYHIDHFTCSVCPTVFGAQDSYYEHDGQVYCHYHYSTRFAQRCNGCQTAILKQFVEIFRNGQNQHWHPECYMIHKFWNVRLASPQDVQEIQQESEDTTNEEGRNNVRLEEERMEEKVYKIWSVLSTFEESSAACISDMLLHVSNGAYMDGVMVAKKFIWHVDILFCSADKLDGIMTRDGSKGLSYSREAKLLCKKIVAFFSLLSKTQETGVRKLGVTQELLALVTGLAHYLKLLIRICLQGALKVERDQKDPEGLHQFLDDLGDMDAIKNDDRSLEATTGTPGLSAPNSDSCIKCQKPIEDECARFEERRCHLACLQCSNCERDLAQNLEDIRFDDVEQRVYCSNCQSQSSDVVSGFVRVTRLQQYVFLLRVALARLLEILRTKGTLPHTSDDPNLNGYNSSEGHKVPSDDDPPMLRSEARSKSFGGPVDENPRESSYENTLNDVRRLRSTRMDKHLSSTIKKARTSRIMDGVDSKRPGSAGADGSNSRNNEFQVVEDRDGNGESRTELMFGHQDALTLDDIPRIVAAEQAKEQRPNAYKHARHELFRTSITEPKLINGHQRTFSAGNDLDAQTQRQQQRVAGKKYFSELSALEYFIVRHVAVIAMQPMLDGHFTMEELLNLIETRKPTFWGKMGKAFKNDGKKTAVKKKGVFGIPLDVIVEKDGAESTDGVGPGALKIPALVDDAIAAMRKMDLSVEGVFRKNGNIRKLNETVKEIDSGGCDAVDLSRQNVVQVAALLKKYLRDLPDPLLTFKLHNLFIASQKIADEDKRRRVLHLTCCLLPKVHRDCLEILCSFFNWVASFHQVDEESGSKMDTHNLATVIAPNIIYTNAKSPVDDNFLAIEVVHTLIECNEQMCEVPEDLQSILNDPVLFNNTSDITTKEILKRYGDISASGGVRHTVETTEATGHRDGNGRPLAPVVTRVDVDPANNAWQKESSVRHVQDAQVGGQGNQNMNPNREWQGGEGAELQHPPQIYREERTRTPDLGNGNGHGHGGERSGDRERGDRREYRNSNGGWGPGRPPQNGGVGVTGAG